MEKKVAMEVATRVLLEQAEQGALFYSERDWRRMPTWIDSRLIVSRAVKKGSLQSLSMGT